jgi:TonB family protein
LDSDAAAEPGYAPPQPVRDVRFAITPDASPMLMREGRMDLKATVDASGRVTKVELLSPRDEKLVGLAASAANGWRFAPAELNGSPVAGEVLLHFDFDNTPAAQAAIDASKIR